MSAAVRVTRTDHTGSELRALSAKCSDGVQVRCVLAVAFVLEGRPRSAAAAPSGMDRQTLSDRVHRYNAEGIEGLSELVVNGPDPAVHKVVRWRYGDLRAEVARRWSVEVHESTIGTWLGARPDPAAAKAGASEEGCRSAGRNLVPRRSGARDARQGRSTGYSRVYMGAGRFTAVDGAR